MAISVKDAMGNIENVTSNAKGNLGVALGGTALGLGILNGGLGILGANDGNGGGILNGNGGCKVSQEKYYEDRIADIRANNAQTMAFQLQLCDLQARVASNEVANSYQNKITDIGFANVDTRFGTERLITDYEIDAKTCHFVKGNLFLSSRNLADSYVSPTRVLDSHEARIYDRKCGSFDGWDNGCAPCSGYGYRGF